MRRAAPLVAHWKGEIEAAKQASHDPVESDIRFWQRAFGAEADPVASEVLERQLSDHAERLEEQQPGSGVAFYKRVTGAITPTTDHLDAWIETLTCTEKTKDMNRADIVRLGSRFPTLDLVLKKDVRRWCDGLIQGDGLKPKTVTRILSACRGYWRYLQAIEVVPDDVLPFNNLELSRSSSKQTKGDERRPFSAKDVVRLLKEAEKKGDDTLADLIRLGMWTGARIEELCSLPTERVHKDYFEIADAKTPSGWREVPIHPRVAPVFKRLVKDSKDGFVLSGLTTNKYDDRSNAIGKRFGSMKTRMGFDGTQVFHSIRKTVATLLENAGVPENVAADIIGHDKPTITYGMYSGGADLKTKRAALRKITYPL